MSAPAVRPVPVLRGARVTLRLPVAADSDVARRIGLHPEILLGYGAELGEWRELSAAEAVELLAILAPDADKVEWVVKADSGCVGTARLHAFDEPHRTAAYAVGLMAPESLGHCLGTEVTRLVSAHAFDDLGLEALTVRVLDYNRRAIGCYARCGFVPDHREPRVLEVRGEWRDDIIMRLTQRDFATCDPRGVRLPIPLTYDNHGLFRGAWWYTHRASQVAAAGPRRDAPRNSQGSPSRKVRTPQSKALANGQPGKPEGKRNREQTASGPFRGVRARVKR